MIRRTMTYQPTGSFSRNIPKTMAIHHIDLLATDEVVEVRTQSQRKHFQKVRRFVEDSCLGKRERGEMK